MEVHLSCLNALFGPKAGPSNRRSIVAQGKKKKKREYGSGREQFGLPPIEPENGDSSAPKLSEYLAFGQLMGDTPIDVQRQLQLNNTAVVVEEECLELLSDWETEEMDAYAMFEALMEAEGAGSYPNSTLARNKNRAGIADVLPPPPKQSANKQPSAAQRKLAKNKGVVVPAKSSTFRSLGGMLQLHKPGRAGGTAFEQLAPRPVRPAQQLMAKPQRPGATLPKAAQSSSIAEEHEFLNDDDIWDELASSTPTYADFDALLATEQASSLGSVGKASARKMAKQAKPPSLLPKPTMTPSTGSMTARPQPRPAPQLLSPPKRAAPASQPTDAETAAPSLAPRPARPSSDAAGPPPVLTPPQQGQLPATSKPAAQAASQIQQPPPKQQPQRQKAPQAAPPKLKTPPSRAAIVDGVEESKSETASGSAGGRQTSNSKQQAAERTPGQPGMSAQQIAEVALASTAASDEAAEQQAAGGDKGGNSSRESAAQLTALRPAPAKSSASPTAVSTVEKGKAAPAGQLPAATEGKDQAQLFGEQAIEGGGTRSGLGSSDPLSTSPDRPSPSIRSLTGAAVAAANWAASQRAKQGVGGSQDNLADRPAQAADTAGRAAPQRPQRLAGKGRGADAGGQLSAEQRVEQRQQMLRSAREYMQRNEVLEVKVWRVNAAGVLVEGEGISGFIPMTQLTTQHGKRVLEQEALLAAELAQHAQQQDGDAEGGASNEGSIDRTAVRRRAMGVLLGVKLSACVIVVEEEKGQVVLSERAASPKQRSVDAATAAEVAAAALPLVGQVVAAKVLSVKRFGCFVEFEIPAPQPPAQAAPVGQGLEGSDVLDSPQGSEQSGAAAGRTLVGLGLVHTSQLSWEPDVEPSDVVQVGQSLRAVIFHVDVSKGRVFLSLRHATTHPLQETLETLLHLTANPGSEGGTPQPHSSGGPPAMPTLGQSDGSTGGVGGVRTQQDPVTDLRDALGDMADAVRFCEAMVQVPGVAAARPGWRLQSRASSQALEVYLAKEDGSPAGAPPGHASGAGAAGWLPSYRLVLRKGLSVQEVVVTAKLPREEVRQLAADVVAELVAAGE